MLSIVLPCYNEKEAIGLLIDKIHKSTKGIQSEVIVVDDSSVDGSAEIAEERDAKVIRHPKNKGYGASLKTGIRAAQYENILLMDADNTYPPEEISRFFELRDYDMVKGIRQTKAYFHRRIGRFLLSLLVSILAWTRIYDVNSGMMMIKKSKFVDILEKLPDSFSFSTSITIEALKRGFSLTQIPIGYKKRLGKSKLSFFRSFYRFPVLVVRIAVDYYPLKVFVPISFIVLGAAMFSLYTNIPIENITDTTVILFLLGIQILLFGLLANSMQRETPYPAKYFTLSSLTFLIPSIFSLIRDVSRHNITSTTMLLFLAGTQIFLFGLLADSLSRRVS